MSAPVPTGAGVRRGWLQVALVLLDRLLLTKILLESGLHVLRTVRDVDDEDDDATELWLIEGDIVPAIVGSADVSVYQGILLGRTDGIPRLIELRVIPGITMPVEASQP